MLPTWKTWKRRGVPAYSMRKHSNTLQGSLGRRVRVVTKETEETDSGADGNDVPSYRMQRWLELTQRGLIPQAMSQRCRRPSLRAYVQRVDGGKVVHGHAIGKRRGLDMTRQPRL